MSNPLIQQALTLIRMAVVALCSADAAPFADRILVMGHLDVVSTFSDQNFVLQIQRDPSRSLFLQPAVLAPPVEAAYFALFAGWVVSRRQLGLVHVGYSDQNRVAPVDLRTRLLMVIR